MENNDPKVQEAIRLANSPAGQQLLKLMQQSSGSQLQQAMTSAAAGDYRQARQVLASLLADPKAKKLLEQMGGGYGSDGR